MKPWAPSRTAVKHCSLLGLVLARLDSAICTHRSPWPKSELWFCLVSRRAPLSFRPKRSVVAKDRSSFGPQSITTTSRQLSAKTAARPMQIHSSFFFLGKIARRFPSATHLNSLRLISDKSKIRTHHNKRPPRPNESKPGRREKILPAWGGGYGKCTGEDFFNQLPQNWWG